MNTKTFIAVVVAAIMVSACASPARIQSMTAPMSASVQSFDESPFKGNLRVVEVYGGGETNPLWTSQVSGAAFKGALEESLKVSGLAPSAGNAGRFEVYATLGELDQPMFGLDMTVNSRVRYEIVEADSRAPWFNKQIPASYTATFGDAALGVERLRVANEGSIRENIRIFIEELLRASPPG